MPKKIEGVRVDAKLRVVEAEEDEGRVKAELQVPDPCPESILSVLKAGKIVGKIKEDRNEE